MLLKIKKFDQSAREGVIIISLKEIYIINILIAGTIGLGVITLKTLIKFSRDYYYPKYLIRLRQIK